MLRTTYLIAALLGVSQIICAQNCDAPTVFTTMTAGETRLAAQPHTPFQVNYDPITTFGPLDSVNVSLWEGILQLGGFDPGGNLKYAGGFYSNGTDYFSGPLTEEGAIPPDGCLAYDQFFRINRADIVAHQMDFDDGILDDTLTSILRWPGANNATLSNFPLYQNLRAPFVDLNQNGTYEPLLGEYPDIYGAQAIWSITNDAGNVHTATSGDPGSFEVQTLITLPDPDTLAGVIFYEVLVANRGLESIDSFHLGLMLDPDAGCFTNNLLGSFPDQNMTYVIEAENPANCTCSGLPIDCATYHTFVCQLVDARFAGAPDTYDLNSVTFFRNPAAPGTPPGASDPISVQDHYNYLTGTFRDGSPMYAGGDGYLETDFPITNFAFGDTINWNPCGLPTPPSDYRMLPAVEFGTFDPGDRVRVVFALRMNRQTALPCDDLSELIDQGMELVSYWEDRTDPMVVNTPNLPAPDQWQLFPNPTTDVLQLGGLPDQRERAFRLMDARGSEVRRGRTVDAISLAGLPAGVYFLTLEDEQQRWTGRVVKL